MREFVRENLGPNIFKRDECLNHNSLIAKSLFSLHETQLILKADGTYC